MSPTKQHHALDQFYEDALTEAEQVRLPHVRKIEGLDEEIAVLRVQLFTALETLPPERFDTYLKLMNALVRAVATRYRISNQAKDDFAENLFNLIKTVMEQIRQV